MTANVLPAASGGGLAFVAGPLLLLVGGAVDAAFTESAWAAIHGAAGFQSLLDLLTAKGLAATPAFALIEWEPGTGARLILRGGITLEVTDATGTQPLSAAGVSTWVERSLPGVTGIALSVPAATAAGTASLPLDAGVALVAGLSLGVRAPATVSDVVSTRPQLQKVARPEAEPRELAQPEGEPDLGLTMAGLPDNDVPSDPLVDEYESLFAETRNHSVADAAVRQPDETEEAAALAGDHDGQTVMRKPSGGRRPRAVAPAPQQAPAAVPVLVISTTGARESLAQPILVGRNPSLKVEGGRIPKFITIPGNDQDISRNHVQVAVEGGTVVVTDLHSKNGTSIVMPGKDAQKLRPGEPTAVLVGTVVDLGGGITLTVDEDA